MNEIKSTVFGCIKISFAAQFMILEEKIHEVGYTGVRYEGFYCNKKLKWMGRTLETYQQSYQQHTCLKGLMI